MYTHIISVPNLDNFLIHGEDQVERFVKADVFDGKIKLVILDKDRQRAADVVKQDVTGAGTQTHGDTVSELE